MKARAPANRVWYGPWLVAAGVALWGTESAWRIPLNQLFDAEVIVFWEHVLIFLMFLPLLLSRLSEIPKIDARSWGYIIFSAFAGSAVGTIFFTCRLFGDRLAPRFYLFAGIAIVAGIFLSVDRPEMIGVSFQQAGLNLGTGLALICALFWGLSTVAGRGVMLGMSLRLAARDRGGRT